MSLHRKIELKKYTNADFGLKFPEFQKKSTQKEALLD